uniref:peptidylprolyl isomerase n=1 Tax=Polytomella parva TaxID=51329 RepID=A0A7S0UZ28_9CHLO
MYEDEDEEMFFKNKKPSVIIEEVTSDDECNINKPGQIKAIMPPPASPVSKKAAESKKDQKKKDSDKPVEKPAEKASPKPSEKSVDKTPAAPAEKVVDNKVKKETPVNASTKRPAVDAPSPQQPKKQNTEQKKEAKKSDVAEPAKTNAAGEVKATAKNVRKWENGFQYEELIVGPANGKKANQGNRVSVRYVGSLKSNGKVFDRTTGKPFSFRLGVGEVIKGWDVGVNGMRVGDKRRLTIPPQMAYGSSGAPPTIPPNATLVFDVELVDVKNK